MQHEEGNARCFPRWQLYAAFAGFAIIVLVLSDAVACCCGPLGFIDGRLWAISPPPAARAHHHLERLAKFLETGGSTAIEVVANDLDVEPAAVREWWVQWLSSPSS